MIDFIIASIISTQEIEQSVNNQYQISLRSHESYINYQLRENYNIYNKPIVFSVDIPPEFHNDIRRDAEASGWTVSIEQIQQNYSLSTYYRFTFTRM